jgi:hypothetical protein
MKTKISKAQTEVWEWKENASKTLSNIPLKDIPDFISKEVFEMKSSILEIRKTKYSDNKDNINFVAEK